MFQMGCALTTVASVLTELQGLLEPLHPDSPMYDEGGQDMMEQDEDDKQSVQIKVDTAVGVVNLGVLLGVYSDARGRKLQSIHRTLLFDTHGERRRRRGCGW